MALIYFHPLKYNLKSAFKNSTKHISTTTFKLSSNIENNKPDFWENSKPYSSIPGPKPIPLLGNLWLFLPFVGTLYKSTIAEIPQILHKKYGKIFRLGSLPRPDAVFVCDPRDIETVCRNEGIYPIREAGTKTISYYRNTLRRDIFQGVGGMLTVQGKEWHDIRSKVNPILMQPQIMFQYIQGIDLITNELLSKIRHFIKTNQNNEMPDDFMNTIYSWTMESAAYIALDKRLGCLELHLKDNSESLKLIQNVIISFKLFEELEFRATFGDMYKSKKWKQFVEVVDYLALTFLKYVDEAESQKKETNATSVLQQLLKVDRKIAFATAFDTFFAGVDTTGKQTTCILYYLAKNQDAQDILRNELLTLLPNKDSPITKDVLDQASYLKAVIKETERLAPISQGNMRESVKDLVLSGYQIPKGTVIITCNGIASRLEENYPRALEFLPERWLRSTTSELSHKHTNPFVSLPFGFGPRSCVGKRIAHLEMEVGVAKLIRNFRVMWHHKEATFGGAPFVGILDPLRFEFNETER